MFTKKKEWIKYITMPMLCHNRIGRPKVKKKKHSSPNVMFPVLYLYTIFVVDLELTNLMCLSF
jgi:hypothetical protein